MKRWTLSAICLLVLFALSACGSGNVPAENTPVPAANNGDAKANTPDDTPKEDPNKWREVEATHPGGWHTLEKYGLTELVNTKALKKAPAGFTFLDGITNPKPPGATEQDDAAWTEWGEQLSAAALFHVGKTGDALKALKDNGDKLVNGFDAGSASMNGDVAVAKAGDGKYVLATVSNENGTYLVVGVIIKEENRVEHERAIVKWAGSLKAK